LEQLYIITTKGKPFALKLLEQYGIAVHESHVFGLGSGPKVATASDLSIALPDGWLSLR
jgi:hypothetical protein